MRRADLQNSAKTEMILPRAADSKFTDDGLQSEN